VAETFYCCGYCADKNLFFSLVWNDSTCALSMFDKFVLISHEAGWLLLLPLQNDK
jgi:hypothetical protein